MEGQREAASDLPRNRSQSPCSTPNGQVSIENALDNAFGSASAIHHPNRPHPGSWRITGFGTACVRVGRNTSADIRCLMIRRPLRLNCGDVTGEAKYPASRGEWLPNGA
jgi:hypothetical protein